MIGTPEIIEFFFFFFSLVISGLEKRYKLITFSIFQGHPPSTVEVREVTSFKPKSIFILE